MVGARRDPARPPARPAAARRRARRAPRHRRPGRRGGAGDAARGGARVTREEQLLELRRALRELLHTERRLRSREPEPGRLSWPQYRVVHALVELGGTAPAGKLAVAAEMTPASLTQAVDGLAALGLVERARSDADRRRVDVVLTAAGREKYDAVGARIQPLWDEAFGDDTPEELAQATRTLERLTALLLRF
ncbi:MarR family transcriptional regulator [Conexibacter sp. W3-3-2]|nr:MarR family transcriptional regulator [Conexibacter sp. W3-3-2]